MPLQAHVKNEERNGDEALPRMESVAEASYRKTLELQNTLSYYAWIKQVLLKMVELEKVNGKRRRLGKFGENQLGLFGNKGLLTPMKGGI